MKARLIAGYLCVALGFALILLLGWGVIDPIGMPAGTTSMGAILLGLLPSVLMALGAFLIGLWLLKGSRRNGAGRHGGRKP
jgi:hypothetical protein